MSEPLSARLERHTRALSEPRHWRTSPGGLRRAEIYVEEQFEGLGLPVRRESFSFLGRSFDNVVASIDPPGARGPRILIGAHLDTVSFSPGANDNGSGLAGLIEAGRALTANPVGVPVDLAAFQLEEWQGLTYRVGSRQFVKSARRSKTRYRAALVYDMIGCRRTEPETQFIPKVVSWMGFPTTGDFIAVLGDGRSRSLVRTFRAAADAVASELSLVTLAVPLRGWPVWHTRRSDNASFWDARIPSVMITDTGNLRNPRYHKTTDTPEYLDYGFMSHVVEATVETARRVAVA